MASYYMDSQDHERSHLVSELESLGLRIHQTNEFNDNSELRDLVNGIKGYYLREYALQSE
jgi:hypothetical protein